MALELVQVVCAFGIVVAYALLQLGRARARGPAFLATNLICAAGMGATAVLDFQPGFVITNSLWVAVSAAGLARVLHGRLNSPRHPGSAPPPFVKAAAPLPPKRQTPPRPGSGPP